MKKLYGIDIEEKQYSKGNCIRPWEELNKINTQEADEAFQKCKKELLDVYMKEKGFARYKTTGYVRLNQIGLIEYIKLQKEAYGSKTFTLNISLMPIYVPHDYLTTGFGKRIGRLVANRDFWWDLQGLIGRSIFILKIRIWKGLRFIYPALKRWRIIKKQKIILGKH